MQKHSLLVLMSKIKRLIFVSKMHLLLSNLLIKKIRFWMLNWSNSNLRPAWVFQLLKEILKEFKVSLLKTTLLEKKLIKLLKISEGLRLKLKSQNLFLMHLLNSTKKPLLIKSMISSNKPLMLLRNSRLIKNWLSKSSTGSNHRLQPYKLKSTHCHQRLLIHWLQKDKNKLLTWTNGAKKSKHWLLRLLLLVTRFKDSLMLWIQQMMLL